MIMDINFSLNEYSNLPILRVRAGSRQVRAKYIDQLLHALHKRSLTGICIKQKNSAWSQRNEILALVRRHDLVIIDTKSDGSAPDELRGGGEDQQAMTPGVADIILHMDTLVRRTPVWACILIGGKSSRMGQPKHLIKDGQGLSWLERSVQMLAPLVDKVVVSGTGHLPDTLGDMARLADIPGVAGPLTGIVAASRWQPMVSWLLVACDMPHCRKEAIQWLLGHRHAGCWGLLPKRAGSTRAEPLLAWYDYRAGPLLEEQLVRKNLRIGDVATHPKIDTPLIPEHLRQSWQNINTPDQLSAACEPKHQSR